MRKMLRNDQWERIERLLPGKATDPGTTAKDNRLFMSGAMDCTHWRTLARFAAAAGQLAQHVYALLALGQEGRLATGD